jgi:hypothetical protein
VKSLRALLTGFLIGAAALLSFGALRHRALEAGIIHGDLLWGYLSAHTLAGIWALVLKVLAAVGILGIRESKGRDPRAWVALGLGLGLDLWFQTYGYGSWIARGQAAVPPLALALAVWIFEVPQARPDWAIPTPLGHPVPDDPAPEPDADQPDQGQPRPKTRTNGTRFTADQRQRIAAMVAREASAKEIQRDLGVSDRAYRDHLLPLVRSLKGDLVRTSGGGS